MKTVLVAVTGGIAAYKALDVITGLKANNFCVQVMATQNAFNFVTESCLKVACDHYYEDTKSEPVHILATDYFLRAFVIVPATANIMGKIVAGIADDLVSSTVLAIDEEVPKIICPAMNTRMWNNQVVQRNIKNLKEMGWYVIPPVEGKLACGTTGRGKLDKPRSIVNQILKIVENHHVKTN